jgi:hypothetical protein
MKPMPTLLGLFAALCVIPVLAQAQTAKAPQGAVKAPNVTVKNQCERTTKLRFNKLNIQTAAGATTANATNSLSELNPFGFQAAGGNEADFSGIRQAKANVARKKVSESNPFAFSAATSSGGLSQLSLAGGESYTVTVSRCTGSTAQIAIKNHRTKKVTQMTVKVGANAGTFGVSFK